MYPVEGWVVIGRLLYCFEAPSSGGVWDEGKSVIRLTNEGCVMGYPEQNCPECGILSKCIGYRFAPGVPELNTDLGYHHVYI